MQNKKLKNWIIEFLIKDKKTIRARSCKRWFINNNFEDKYKDIIKRTGFFLEKTCSFSQRIYCIIQNIHENPQCLICKNLVKWRKYSLGYHKYCSIKCAASDLNFHDKRKKTNLKKYGVEHAIQSKQIKEKTKKTNLERYGTEYSIASKQIKEKTKKTNLERYGTEYSIASKKIRTKIKKTNLKKYGVENPFQSQEIKNKIEKTNIKKYGAKHISQSHISSEIYELLNNKKWLEKQHYELKMPVYEIARNLCVSIKTAFNYFKKHNIKIRTLQTSFAEEKLYEFINLNIKKNNRNIISPYELDIYVPEHQLAIEFDGLYWHSSEYKNKKYHLTKTNLCQEKGINLLHVFENEWLDSTKQDIWKSIINSKLGKNDKIFARKCEIKEIKDNKLIRLFLESNHLQDFAGSSIKVGLFHDNELVSLMTFGKTRYSKKYQWEMIRFCNKKYINVVGGPSRLFKYFVRNYEPESIVSYVDKRYSNGNMYSKLNFKHSHDSAPNYFYFKPHENVLYPRVKFQKHKLEKQLKIFDPKLSEVDNMFNNNYRRVWDCGNMVYIKNNFNKKNRNYYKKNNKYN